MTDASIGVMSERRDVVLSDSRRIAKSVMEQDWGWSPQRVKDALVVTSKSQVQQMRSSGPMQLFVAGDYPQKDCDAIYEAIKFLDCTWVSPFAQRSS
jgi:hypothetical protein